MNIPYFLILLQDGVTALMYATSKGHKKCVKALLLGGADVNIPDNVSSTKAVRCLLLMLLILALVYDYIYRIIQDGKTALMVASLGGHNECVEALLKRGAQVKITDNVSSTKSIRCLLLMCVLVVCG